jgi:hypothetical protein
MSRTALPVLLAIAVLAGCGEPRDLTTGSPGGIHAAGYADPANPVFHGPDAIRFLTNQPAPDATACSTCHAPDLNGSFGPSCNACHAAAGFATWQSNCTFCHGVKNAAFAYASDLNQAAPPLDVAGLSSGARVGAHQKHLGAGSRAVAFACATCHAVPEQATALAHLDGTATVSLRGAGQAALPADLGAYTPATQTCATYCHGSTLQGGSVPALAWTASDVACNTCHGLPPATGRHASNFGPHAFMGTNCALCHLDVADTTLNVVDRTKHVNGVVDVRLVTGIFAAGGCSTVACHGAGSPPQPWIAP